MSPIFILFDKRMTRLKALIQLHEGLILFNYTIKFLFITFFYCYLKAFVV